MRYVRFQPMTRGPEGSEHGRRRWRGQRGDTLIEVLISVAMLAVIVIGTLTGLDALNRSTTLDRDRSQADALAQQEQELLRSEPVSKLTELDRVRTVAENGTKYTITTKAGYISDTTATSSCTTGGTSEEADEIKTESSVTWPTMGVTKPVVETSLITPPPGTLMIVNVSNPAEQVEGAKVTIAGPVDSTTETSNLGCSLINISPGEYTLNVTKPGYIDQNGFTNTDEDLSDTRTDYFSAGASERIGYQLAVGGTLKVKFKGTGTEEGDTFVAFNTGQSALRTFGTAGTYGTSVASAATLFPFSSPYTVYAGTCEADLPTDNGGESDPQATVTAGTTTEVTVPVTPFQTAVYSGTSSTAPGTKVTGAEVVFTDEGCKTTRTETTTSGAIPHPSLPYGKYSVCVSSTGPNPKKWSGTFKASTTGPTWTTAPNGGTEGATGIFYLGTSPSGSPTGVSTGECA